MAIPKSMNRDSLRRRKAIINETTRNHGGHAIMKGSIVEIRDVVRGKGITIKTNPCPLCGQHAYITGISRDALTLCKDNEERPILTLQSMIASTRLTKETNNETIIILKMPDRNEYHIVERHLLSCYDCRAITIDMDKPCIAEPYIMTISVNETRLPTKYRDRNGDVLWIGSKITKPDATGIHQDATISMYADGRPTITYDEHEDITVPLDKYNADNTAIRY